MLELRDIRIGLRGVTLVHVQHLAISGGEIITLMGPSGVGKSTLLSYIGGDVSGEFTSEGSVTLDGQDLAGVPPERRGIGRLYQDDFLFPHMTVAENLAFAVRDRTGREAQVQAALGRAGLAGFGDRPPHTLSGGQRARVALMRTLLARPSAILLDEPFNRLDLDLRQAMREFSFAHIRERAIPALLVTHDPSDVPPGGRLMIIGSKGLLTDA